MPVALQAPEQRLTVAPVCSARTLAEGRPPLGIACAQQDVARIYALADDPERCLDDFAEPPPSTPTASPGGWTTRTPACSASSSSTATTSPPRADAARAAGAAPAPRRRVGSAGACAAGS